ncbi:response regulator [Pararhizobium gei]|uniref:response regulator n=1 Tax=Pararhizobium gei TaxID=1395951 RepID=UPI0023DA6176|nr:response regulator [Rhizobium gei]
MEKPLLLVVEDEPLLHLAIEDALEEAGYAVLFVSSGDAATTELDADAARFKGVITDIRLGSKISGWQVAQRAREHTPEMPVVYMTGDSAHDWASKGVPNSLILQKPFAMAQLVTAISQLINGGTGTQI